MRIITGTVGCLLLALSSSVGAQSMGGLSNLAQVKDATSKRASSYDPDWAAGGNGDARPIAPGETLVVADLTGPGVITHIWITIAAEDEKYPRLLALRMYWDDETHPSVEAPVGDFFAVGHGLDVEVHSLPVAVTSNGRARNCYWPMPFGKRARIEVTNEGSKPVNAFYYYVDWEQVERLPDDTAYFHAMYRQEFPARHETRYMYADIEGRGHYVGTVHSARARTPSWIGEGDDFFYIDGETEPSLKGTGTEDYYCDAWGFREVMRPYYGIPLFEGYETGHRTSVYRWHIPDPIRFNTSLFAEIEHVGPEGLAPDGSYASAYGIRPDDIASVAYWYQLEPHKPWTPMPVGAERLYTEDVSALLFEPDAYPPYVKLALLMMMGDIGAHSVPIDPEAAGTMAFDINNPTPFAMDVAVRFEGDSSIAADKDSLCTRLEPGATTSLPVTLTVADGVPDEHVQPLRAQMDYEFDHPGDAPIVVTVDRSVVPAMKYTVASVSAPIAIDGDLGEWGDLRFKATHPAQLKFGLEAWQGPADCSWSFDVRANDTYLYIGVDVVDDELALLPGQYPWQQDGLEIRLTALPDNRRDEYAGENEFDDALLVAISPGHDATPFKADALPEGTRVACVPTPGGFAAELAVPASWLDAQQGRPWKTIRLNIAVNDRDGDRQTQLWWRPDWRTNATFPGSGTFVR